MTDSSNSVNVSFPESSEAWGELGRLSAQGTPVVFTGVDDLDPVEACLLMDFFLHDPEAAGRVEPFSSLLSAIAGKKDISLWDLVPKAELGERTPENSGKPGHAHCGYFSICKGYGVSNGSCSTWQAILARLVAAAKEQERVAAI